jgi:hypothetical protein
VQDPSQDLTLDPARNVNGAIARTPHSRASCTPPRHCIFEVVAGTRRVLLTSSGQLPVGFFGRVSLSRLDAVLRVTAPGRIQIGERLRLAFHVDCWKNPAHVGTPSTR